MPHNKIDPPVGMPARVFTLRPDTVYAERFELLIRYGDSGTAQGVSGLSAADLDRLAATLTERVSPDRFTLYAAAVELHRPVGFDRFAHETTEAAAIVQRRCRQCHETVSVKGCRTWQAAHPDGVSDHA